VFTFEKSVFYFQWSEYGFFPFLKKKPKTTQQKNQNNNCHLAQTRVHLKGQGKKPGWYLNDATSAMPMASHKCLVALEAKLLHFH